MHAESLSFNQQLTRWYFLVEAIEKTIAGAGIDVVTQEPPGFILNYPNFILTPHTAWIGLSTIKRAWNQVLENIENFKKGKPTRVLLSFSLNFCKSSRSSLEINLFVCSFKHHIIVSLNFFLG